MRTFLKKTAFFSLIVLAYFTMTGIYNYNIDPYGILEKRKEFPGIRPNEHSLKVHHILQNTDKFNSFLFSNSKGGALHFNQLNNESDRWYNMTYSLGTPDEFYADMLLFVKNDVEVKNIVVGLDEGAIYERASSHINQASRKFVPMEEDKIHWEYLFLPISFKKISGVDENKKHIVHDIYKDGNYYAKNAYDDNCDDKEELVLLPHPVEEVEKQLDFSSQIETLQKIQNLCHKNKIHLTFLIHPTSQDNLKKSTEKLLQFKQLLISLKKNGFDLFEPFGNSLFENNSCYWLDRHHYSKKIGDSILQMYVDFSEAENGELNKR
ncbi:hypothetical protein B0O79_1730 [Flavobacteriaceae bacterium MAR_2009_75]|nr:hypothetical protein B0O79_1730 [Flavobacteriaceae bacterium MAR_2009_75]